MRLINPQGAAHEWSVTDVVMADRMVRQKSWNLPPRWSRQLDEFGRWEKLAHRLTVWRAICWAKKCHWSQVTIEISHDCSHTIQAEEFDQVLDQLEQDQDLQICHWPKQKVNSALTASGKHFCPFRGAFC
jgi:hypothetical protein